MPASYKALLVVPALMLFSAEAGAVVTERVKQACQSDYYAYCGEHAVGSSSLRVCMRKSQYKLSKPCLRALVASGEVSRHEIRRYHMGRR